MNEYQKKRSAERIVKRLFNTITHKKIVSPILLLSTFKIDQPINEGPFWIRLQEEYRRYS
jgi:hypothetical protein